MSEPIEGNGEIAPPVQEVDVERLARGVEAARLLEESSERVQRARRHAKTAKKGDARRACRDQLKRLARTLAERQEEVLSKGLDADDYTTLGALLHALDRALDEFLTLKPRKARLKQTARAAKITRKSL